MLFVQHPFQHSKIAHAVQAKCTVFVQPEFDAVTALLHIGHAVAGGEKQVPLIGAADPWSGDVVPVSKVRPVDQKIRMPEQCHPVGIGLRQKVLLEQAREGQYA